MPLIPRYVLGMKDHSLLIYNIEAFVDQERYEVHIMSSQGIWTFVTVFADYAAECMMFVSIQHACGMLAVLKYNILY